MENKLCIKRKKLTELKPAPYNPRKDIRKDPYFYDKLNRSITQWGIIDPIIWNEQTGHVVGGNQRLAILQDKKIKETDVIVINIPPIEEKTLNIALNKITGTWDNEKLSQLFQEIKIQDDLFLDLTGFTEKETDEIIGDFQPATINEQSPLDQKVGEEIECPNCKHRFIP